MVERTLISFPSQLQLIERLQHLLYLSSSMVFISGEKGSGKSTLVEQLSNQLPHQTKQAFIRLAEPTSASQIRQQIISQLFEQPVFDADDTLCNALLLLKERRSSDIARVVVIDNAHLLPKQLLHELAEVVKQKTILLDNEINFVLLGEELKIQQMVSQVKQFSDHQGIAALAFKLPPLDVNEAQQLLTHSLDQLGYTPKVQHQDALAAQLLNCHGIPEKILLLATEISSNNIENKAPSWLTTRFPAILLMLVLVAVAGGLAFYLYPIFIKPQAEVQTIALKDRLLLDELQSSRLTDDEISTVESVLESAEQIAIESTEALAGEWSNNTEDSTDNLLSGGEADITIPSEPFELISDDVIEDVATELPETLSEVELVNTDNLAIQDEAMLIASLEETVDVSDEKEIPAPIADEEIETNYEVLEPISASNYSEQQVVKVKSLEILQQDSSLTKKGHKPFTPSSSLLAINPDFYTLQLAAMSSEKSLQEFIRESKLTEKDISLYQTMRNGKKWFVVIYGQFKSRKTALLEVKKLSNSAAKLDSWAKKYASVHQDLQLNE